MHAAKRLRRIRTPLVAIACAAAFLALAIQWIGRAAPRSVADSFRAGIQIHKVSVYCTKTDDRLHVDARVAYGEILARLRSRYPRARVVTRATVFRRRGGPALGRASSAGTVEYGAAGKRVDFNHRAVLGRNASSRVLRAARGSTSCDSGSKRRRIAVAIESVARAEETGGRPAGSGASSNRPRQRHVYRSAVSVRTRECGAAAGEGCADGDVPAAAPGGSSVPVAPCSNRQPGGNVESDQVTEASGIAASRRNADVLWVHNDSGDSARLFAMTTTGAHLGVYNLTGASATDWEDMAIGPGPGGGDYLYVGDIGDNSTSRVNVTVYRVPEPAVSADQPPATVDLPGVESLDLAYPDGPRDAETLIVDPQNADLYIVSKSDPSARVYRFSSGEWGAGLHTLTYVGALGFGGATAGDVAPNGQEVLIKRYGSIHLYTRAAGTDIAASLTGSGESLPYTLEPQGEAVAFDCAGSGYFTVSEGSHQPIHYYER